jgi:hypothetical protein
MFANLSTVILYYWSLKNNIKIPIIIPILLVFRSLSALLPGSIIYKIVNLEQPMSRTIEYILAILINILLVLYLYFNLSKYRNKIEYVLSVVGIIYFIQLGINLFYIIKA